MSRPLESAPEGERPLSASPDQTTPPGDLRRLPDKAPGNQDNYQQLRRQATAKCERRYQIEESLLGADIPTSGEQATQLAPPAECLTERPMISAVRWAAPLNIVKEYELQCIFKKHHDYQCISN
jgi:hypothetical protein